MSKRFDVTSNGIHRTGKKAYLTVNNVHRKVKKAYLTVNGVHKLVFQGNPSLAELPVGSSIFMNMNGVRNEFLIVHQGIPSSMYDASCDGTWLLKKNVCTGDVDYGTNNADYSTSYVRTDVDNLLSSFDSNVQNIIKTVKIPYYKGSGSSGVVASGSSGLETKLFLLGGYEVGWTTADGNFPVDGAVLDYFKGTATVDSKRTAYYDNGVSAGWWLRSTDTTSYKRAWDVYDGEAWNDTFTTLCAIRPALILPNTTIVDDNFNIIA